MGTLVLGGRPPELEQLLARRRVPDQGWHRVRSAGTWLPTAALVVEVVSPGDRSYERFASYAVHDVDEVLIADPELRTVRLWRLRDDRYDGTPRSNPLDPAVADVNAAIDRP